MEKEVIVIKKYTNRRLYNNNESKYVKLDDIAEVIRQGHDIRVIDTQTDEDITKQILAQIILEEEKNKKTLLPETLLYQIIRANEQFMTDFFENYLNVTIESYLAYRKLMEKRLHEMKDVNRLPFELGDLFMKSLGFARGEKEE